MAPSLNPEVLQVDEDGSPRLTHSYMLNLVGDWGGANFHRICAWLTQEFCDRAGPGSRTSIMSLRDGGMDALIQLEQGTADVAIATPTGLIKHARIGGGIFQRPMPHLRALAVLPQNDRMVLAIDPKYGVKTFEDIRRLQPALRIATSTNDGTNFIGYVADQFMEAHGISKQTLESWKGEYVTAHRPEQCTTMIVNGQADALLQEAIMTPWWRDLVEADKLVPLPAETQALEKLHSSLGLATNLLPKGFWNNLSEELPALDFSDFVILVRDDMSLELAYTLAWCLVETRHMIEAQFKHIPQMRSPLSYPLIPEKMALSPVQLHDGAHSYYSQAGHL
ncbi:hypothetical protein H2198_003819 [Neophaeococcomyces mojaviensis]|uniref:Uncharacterized protein n=1 Tax=Neophaeococcomyces mojaviensis TaxID=3383035 RepID=A0ACC3AAB3_9EURO|nr:hypothetical protein H2198_003819 [Knufia sp. JES_112]